MKNYLHGPMGNVKALELRFRAEDLGLPQRGIPVVEERRKKMHRFCPCGKAIERTHAVGKCEMFKEERDVMESRRK